MSALPCPASSSSTHTVSNFNSIVKADHCEVFHPANVDELRRLVRARIQGETNVKIRAAGSGFSFNSITQTSQACVLSLVQHMDQILLVDKKNMCVTVEAGITLHALCEGLHKHNLALSNIPHFGGMTLGGAICTAIHGTTGRKQADTLSSSLITVHLINGRGEDVELSPSHSVLCGAFGVIYKVKIRVIPMWFVNHFAKRIQACDSSLDRISSIAEEGLRDHDFVMYKYLVGQCQDSLLEEVFDIDNTKVADAGSSRVRSESPIEAFTSHAKTLCKYHFPAHPLVTNSPLRAPIYVFLCERHHEHAPYYAAMMGPKTVCPHAEIEWCIPLDSLQKTLQAIDSLVTEKRKTNSFYQQPIECHIRFSLEDSILGHPAHSEGHQVSQGPRFRRNKDVASSSVVAWVNLNVRQQIAEAAEAFAPVENIFIEAKGRPHWSKCWSSNVPRYALDVYATFLRHLKALCKQHDPSGVFHANEFYRSILV
jgi:FAD/FMN-containing dehydrogenase